MQGLYNYSFTLAMTQRLDLNHPILQVGKPSKANNSLKVTELVNGIDLKKFFLLHILCSSHCSPQYRASSCVWNLTLVFYQLKAAWLFGYNVWKSPFSLVGFLEFTDNLWRTRQTAICLRWFTEMPHALWPPKVFCSLQLAIRTHVDAKWNTSIIDSEIGFYTL